MDLVEHQIGNLVITDSTCSRVQAASGLTPVHANNTSGMEQSLMQQNTHEKRFLSPAELAARWEHRVCVRTMANWRTQGNGPRFTKIGGRVLYPLKDVEAWEVAGTVESTAQYYRGPGVLPPAKPKQRPQRIICPGKVVSIAKGIEEA